MFDIYQYDFFCFNPPVATDTGYSVMYPEFT